MRVHLLQRWLTVGAMLALPVMAHAQGEATLSGTVTDSTGGALPGVTVRALNEASGNSFEAVTDARGDYRLPVRVGAYRLTAELAGFAPVTRAVTLLVGQQAVVNLQMAVSGVQESVTVTGEAPLLNVTESSLGGNIDPRQLQELPVNGRNWLDLVLLAPGARTNAVVEQPSDQGAKGFASSRGGGDFELNVDGQQVTSLITGTVSEGQGKGQVRFARDAIAEFEYLSSRFDATQGRSSGMQVNVVTKSGTNTPSGSFSGYFRDDSMIAADPVANRVLPYQDQQLSGTVGGPIRRNRLHLFGYYEYEREPLTFIRQTPYAYFNQDLNGLHTEHKVGLRADMQLSPQTRLMARGYRWKFERPSGGGTVAGETYGVTTSDQLFATLTQVFSNRVVNEVKLGFAGYAATNDTPIVNPNARFRGAGGPNATIQGLTVGGGNIFPNDFGQDAYQVRDDLTLSFTKGGRHTVKLGGEYLFIRVIDFRCITCMGQLVATRAPIPLNFNWATVFPNPYDASTWNLAPLAPFSTAWVESFGNVHQSYLPRDTWAFWLQDDWNVSSRLTVNVGLRYDVEFNALGEDTGLGPFLRSNRPSDTNNVAPRTGLSFSLNDRTVIRGGYGVYFATVTAPRELKFKVQEITLSTPNDGRPDFVTNPYNGLKPTFESLQAKLCTAASVPGCSRPDITWGGILYGPTFTFPYTHQVAIGLQRQLAATMAIDVDYTYGGTRDWPHSMPVNVSYNPATGVNYPFSDISRRPYPNWGYVNLTMPGARANNHALQTSWTKRMSNGWQASGTYTLAALRDAGPRPFDGLTYEPVPFATAPDLGGEYGLAETDQRHRAVFNGIWQLRYGFQVSGLYFFGSGERYFTQWGNGIDLRQTGGRTKEENRLRPDGTIVPRNKFVGKPIHRVDMRLQRRFPLGGRAGIDGLLEVFNLFNHANYGNYLIQEVRSDYGQPSQSTNVAYAPRTLQLGFRVTF